MVMRPLSKIAADLISTLANRVRWQSVAWLLVKLIFIVGASALAAIAQFADAESFAALSQWQVIGISSAAVAGLGGAIITIRERDSAHELLTAHEALDAARGLKAEISGALTQIEDNANHLTRVVSLYIAMRSMRSVLETAKGVALTDVALITSLVLAARRSLLIALGFALKDHWTLSVYRAEKDVVSDKWVLRCIATERSIPCAVANARVWPEGSVPAGVAFALSKEVAIPDTAAEDMASMVDLGVMAKESDSQLYRSMYAAPILVHGTGRAWGVVMATTSKPYHFECSGPEGVRTAEAVRSLADMVALGVAVQDPPITVGTP